MTENGSEVAPRLKADCSRSRRWTLAGQLSFFDSIPKVRTKFRTVLMPMHLHRVLSCSIDEFVCAVGRDRDGAMGFAREFPAIDMFAAHVSLLDVTRAHILSFLPQSYGHGKGYVRNGWKAVVNGHQIIEIHIRRRYCKRTLFSGLFAVRGCSRMANYRLYRLDGAGNISLAEWIEAADDDDALRQTSDLTKDATKCEVWQGKRLVASLDGNRSTG